MHRSGPARNLVALVVALLVLVAPTATATATVMATTTSTVSAAAPTASTTTDVPDAGTPPPVTVSDFYPEDSNLSDCVGLVERPGCGSESRGGWAQNVILVLLLLGLGLIFWRIIVGVRKNRSD